MSKAILMSFVIDAMAAFGNFVSNRQDQLQGYTDYSFRNKGMGAKFYGLVSQAQLMDARTAQRAEVNFGS